MNLIRCDGCKKSTCEGHVPDHGWGTLSFSKPAEADPQVQKFERQMADLRQAEEMPPGVAEFLTLSANAMRPVEVGNSSVLMHLCPRCTALILADLGKGA